MATKAIQAKVIIDAPEKLEYLWLTHHIFNETLPFVIGHVFKMKRGEIGDNFKVIYDSIKSSQNSFAKLEPITQSKHPKKLGSGKNEGEWAEKAMAINRSGKILFDRYKELPAGSEFWRKLFEMTIQRIHGNEELKKLWEDEHNEWLAEKEKWMQENADFLKVLPVFEEFESKEGKITRRRERWHRYLDFFRNNPTLATWRDGKTTLSDFTKDEEKALRERFFRKPGKILEAFFKKNPEIGALDNRYKKYLEYTRPWAKRKFKDGFKHPPTFTMPSSVKHPAWFSFKKGPTYKRLNIKNGTVDLNVLTADNEKGKKGAWFTYNFKADPRLLKFLSKNKEGKGRKAFGYEYQDESGITRKAEIRGIKLMFKGSKLDVKTKSYIPGKPYLVFTCEMEDINSRLSLKQKSFDKYSTKWLREKIFSEIHADELIVCSVDLGIRHLGAATIRKGGDLLKTKFLSLKGPSLEHIASHKRSLRAGRSLRGKPVKGEESFIELQSHITSMGEDRFKKGAHEIVSCARENKADIIILENLKGFIANATYEKGINKALAAWNRGNLVKWIKQTAQYYGLRVIEVDAFYSSRVCSKCGAPGARYSYRKDEDRNIVIPEFEWVGKLFVCYECGYRANADFNASLNLQKIFYEEFKREGLTYKDKEAVFNGKKYIHEKAFAELIKGWKKDTPPEMHTEVKPF